MMHTLLCSDSPKPCSMHVDRDLSSCHSSQPLPSTVHRYRTTAASVSLRTRVDLLYGPDLLRVTVSGGNWSTHPFPMLIAMVQIIWLRYSGSLDHAVHDSWLSCDFARNYASESKFRVHFRKLVKCSSSGFSICVKQIRCARNRTASHSELQESSRPFITPLIFLSPANIRLIPGCGCNFKSVSLTSQVGHPDRSDRQEVREHANNCFRREYVPIFFPRSHPSACASSTSGLAPLTDLYTSKAESSSFRSCKWNRGESERKFPRSHVRLIELPKFFIGAIYFLHLNIIDLILSRYSLSHSL
jgi:hypothetical protein